MEQNTEFNIYAPIIFANTIPAAIYYTLVDKGLSSELVLKDTRITANQFQGPDFYISYSQYSQLMNNGLALVQDPSFVLRAGNSRSVGDYGTLGLLLISQKTFKDMIMTIIDYKDIVMPIMDVSFDDETMALDFHYAPSVERGDKVEKISVESLFCTMARMFSTVFPGNNKACEFYFKHEKPAYSDDYVEVLESDKIFFASGKTKLYFQIMFYMQRIR